MCINRKYIVNPYTHKELAVSCGHCPACLQEKADKRTSRLNNCVNQYNEPKFDIWFVTLTYSNLFCPYIKKSELVDFLDSPELSLPVYRDNERRFVLGNRAKNGKRIVHRKLYRGETMLTEYFADSMNYYTHEFNPEEITSLPDNFRRAWRNRDEWYYYDTETFPVLYYPDIVNYIKRVKKDFSKYEIPFVYFYCGEYGETTLRPHFHVLAFIPKGYYQLGQNILIKNWPYDNNMRKKCESPRKSLSAYVSSYVNCRSFVPVLFQNAWCFAPRHKFSFGAGFGNENFSLRCIMENVDRGTLIVSKTAFINDVPSRIDVPFPKYSLYRYFPKFKGYSSFTSDEIFAVAQRPELYEYYSHKYAERGFITYDAEVVSRTIVMLKNKRYRFMLHYSMFGRMEDAVLLFPYYYVKVWSVYSSTLLRLALMSLSTLEEKTFYYDRKLSHRILYNRMFPHVDVNLTDINRHPLNLLRHQQLVDEFNERSKERNQKNAIYSHFINV